MTYPSDTSDLKYEAPSRAGFRVDADVVDPSVATTGFILFFIVLLLVSLVLSLAVFTQLESAQQHNDELRAFAEACVEEADTCHTTCVEYLP